MGIINLEHFGVCTIYQPHLVNIVIIDCRWNSEFNLSIIFIFMKNLLCSNNQVVQCDLPWKNLCPLHKVCYKTKIKIKDEIYTNYKMFVKKCDQIQCMYACPYRKKKEDSFSRLRKYYYNFILSNEWYQWYLCYKV